MFGSASVTSKSGAAAVSGCAPRGRWVGGTGEGGGEGILAFLPFCAEVAGGLPGPRVRERVGDAALGLRRDGRAAFEDQNEEEGCAEPHFST